MNKTNYLQAALSRNCALDLAWIFSAFCVTKTKSGETQAPKPFQLTTLYPQYRFYNEKLELETLEGTRTTEPLFSFKEKITIGSEWAINVTDTIETTVGALLFNQIVLAHSFGKKIPYIQGKLSVSAIEKVIAPKLTDTPEEGTQRDPDRFYVDEYLNFRDSLVYLEQLAPIVNWGATRKGLSASPGLNAYKKQLLKEYEGRLNDPATFAEYESKLKQFDREWLKDDPAYGTFLSGKVLDISRKQMFIGIGLSEKLDPKEPTIAITRTLEEGQPTEARERVAVLNGARFGSFSRGAETVNGGVVAKDIIRASSNFVIDRKDCETTLGVVRRYTSDTLSSLVGRTIVEKGRSIYVEKREQAEHYVGIPVTVRSPAYCQAGPGDRLCEVCCGSALTQYKEGLVIPMTEVSSIILSQSLKAMHGKVLSTAVVDLDSALS